MSGRCESCTGPVELGWRICRPCTIVSAVNDVRAAIGRKQQQDLYLATYDAEMQRLEAEEQPEDPQ